MFKSFLICAKRPLRAEESRVCLFVLFLGFFFYIPRCCLPGILKCIFCSSNTEFGTGEKEEEEGGENGEGSGGKGGDKMNSEVKL